MTDFTALDIDTLLARIDTWLERGDKKKIAQELGKTSKQVGNYFTRKTKRVPPAVIEKAFKIAIERKRKIEEYNKMLLQ